MYFLILMLTPILAFSQINFDSLILDQERKQIIFAHSQIAQKSVDIKKNKWLNLLPSISYNATANNINVGVSLNSFANFYQLRQRNKIALDDMLQNRIAEIHKETQTIFAMVQDYHLTISELELVKASHEIDRQLFEITTQEYDNNKIDLVSYLTAKKSFILSKKTIDRAQAKADRQYKNILQALSLSL